MSQLVSILIPCFNAERWIGEAIESALGQTHPATEIIVVGRYSLRLKRKRTEALRRPLTPSGSPNGIWNQTSACEGGRDQETSPDQAFDFGRN
jgi:cellulose synthase/poly-beta-1,6-N-acetylglucosamine synthase-like glycosyltransferase